MIWANLYLFGFYYFNLFGFSFCISVKVLILPKQLRNQKTRVFCVIPSNEQLGSLLVAKTPKALCAQRQTMQIYSNSNIQGPLSKGHGCMRFLFKLLLLEIIRKWPKVIFVFCPMTEKGKRIAFANM